MQKVRGSSMKKVHGSSKKKVRGSSMKKVHGSSIKKVHGSSMTSRNLLRPARSIHLAFIRQHPPCYPTLGPGPPH